MVKFLLEMIQACVVGYLFGFALVMGMMFSVFAGAYILLSVFL